MYSCDFSFGDTNGRFIANWTGVVYKVESTLNHLHVFSHEYSMYQQ